MKLFDRSKKIFMLQIWRLQQSQMIISMIFWALTLTGIFYPYVDWRLRLYFGINNATQGMVALFFIVVILILSFGFIYDVIFKMWKQQQMVAQERNPYARDKMMPKEMLYWTMFYGPLLDAQIRLMELENVDKKEIEDMKKKRAFVYKWIAWNIENDKDHRKIAQDTVRAIMKQKEMDVDALLGLAED